MTSIAKHVARISWLAQLILGLLFWTGHTLQLIPLHMTVGGIFVLSLWVLAAATLKAGIARTSALVAIVWGLALAGLGASQARMMIGPAHWVIQVVHLLLAVGAIGLTESLAARVRRGRGMERAGAGMSPQRP